MSESADPLLTRLAKHGLLTPDDLSSIRSTLDSDEKTLDGQELTGQLVGLSKLTPYQADTICAGDIGQLVIGNYIILDLLGSGGMGHVYKARHRDMDRIVALKVLPPERVQSKAGMRRFQQEVKAAARLVHPNIVTAFDADISGGAPYLVMEYVIGKDLQAILTETGPLSFEDALDYTLQTARGLEYAHRVGVIHRDIKPANLLLDEHGTIRILDMGVAQLNQLAEDESINPVSQQITRDGAVIGTTDFMAPEQASNPRDADARSDIYSLGCTLYFMLTNQPLFDADSAVDRIIAHRQQSPPALRDVRPDLPRDLDRVFTKMVAKAPQDRYASVTDLIRDLESLERGEHLETPPLSPVPSLHFEKEVKSHHSEEDHAKRFPLLTFALATIAVMLLAFSGFYYYDNYMPGTGTLELDVDQRGAEVLVIDNLRRGTDYGPTTGTILELKLERGQYNIRISKPGYQTTIRQLDLRPWQTKRLTVHLQESPSEEPPSEGDNLGDLLPQAEASESDAPSDGATSSDAANPPEDGHPAEAEVFYGPH